MFPPGRGRTHAVLRSVWDQLCSVWRDLLGRTPLRSRDEETPIAAGLHIALVFNGGSGGSPAARELTEALEAYGGKVATHPFDELEQIDLGRAQRIVVAAGDGGVGPCAELAERAGIPLALIPSGTANDFAGFLEVPDDREAAVRLAVDPGAHTRTVDLCRAGDRPFLNAAACGMSVAASENATPLKETLGATAYAVGAIQASVSEEACTYRVVVDGETVFDGPAWQVIVSGTGAFGAGSRIEPASEDDGQLDVTVLDDGPRSALPLRAWGLKRGGLTEQDGVLSFRGRTVDVHGAERWNVDGEQVDEESPCAFTLDGRIDVVAP